jgi:glycerol-3-phosphate dehydrogenase
MRRPEAFHIAFALARLLGLHRDGEGTPGRIEVVSTDEVRALLPHCRQDGLNRGALWRDAFMPRPHRVISELLHWAESAGAIVRNRTELIAASRDRERTWRLSVRDHRAGETVEIAARRVINAAGSASDEVIGRIVGRRRNRLFAPTMAWGLLLDRPPVAACSVAVTPRGKGRRTYFLHPYNGYLLAGTGHAPIQAGAAAPSDVPDRRLRDTLADLNEAMPGIGLTREQVRLLRLPAGFAPVRARRGAMQKFIGSLRCALMIRGG